MSYFKKARKYTEPSVALDEKIAKANREYEKTGVDLSEWSGNKTSDVYFAGKEIEKVPAVFTPVPDPNGVRDAGFTQPDGGFDQNDPSTWENSYTDTSWLYNSNEVDGVSNRPVVASIENPSGTTGRFAPGGGLITAHVGYGAALGYLGAGGTYKQLTYASYWGTMYAAVESNFGGVWSQEPYRGYNNQEKALMINAYAKYVEMQNNNSGTVPIKMWYPYSYFWYGQWENVGYVKRDHPTYGKQVLINGSLFTGAEEYKTEDEIPAYTQIIFKDDIGKAENLPNVRGGRLQEILEELFGIGGSAAEELAGGLPYGTPGADDPFDAWDDDDIDLEDDSDFDMNDWDWAGNNQGNDVAWGKPKGPASTSEKLPRAADINAVNWYNSGGDVGSKPEGWSDQDLRDYLNNRDKGFPGAQSSSGGGDLPDQLVAALNNPQMPQYVKDSIKRQYTGKDYSIEDKKNILNWQQRIKAEAGGSDWTPSSGVEVASTDLSGLFGSSGSGSGSTGQLNLPSWFQHGAGKNAKLDADGRIYGYNYSGGYGYLSRGPGSGAPGTAESGYGTKGFDWDTQSGGTSWSFTRHDPSKVAASPNSPDPVKPGDVPTAPSSPYLPGKSPYKVAANAGPSTPIKYYPGMGYAPNMGGGRPGNVRPKGSAAFPQAKKDDTGRGGKGNDFGMGSAVVNKGKKKKKGQVVTASNEITGVVLNESNLLMEKNYLRDLREKKREKTNKTADKVMKINIPGPNDELTVRAIDLLRSYKVSEKEMQEYAIIIGNINNWIRKYPKEYAIWKVRYPKKDPRLAELNWRLDQQLRAADEYMDSHFPENQNLFGKLRQKIAANVDITDPRNFKDVKPAVTHKKLLQVSKALEKE